MKQYPKIEFYNKGIIGLECYAFDKLDGSNLRFEWGRKRGWYKFGTRNNMIDRSYPEFGNGIDLFLNKYGDDLHRVFVNKYSKVESFVVFCEYLGEKSFAGQHDINDIKDVVLFDVNQYKRGFIPPMEFIDNFGHLHIPKVIYQGRYGQDLINSVKLNQYKLSEGVIVKGIEGKEIWMTKIKTNDWLERVRMVFGEKKLLEEVNGDKSILSI
jgi:hypothetical protein